MRIALAQSGVRDSIEENVERALKMMEDAIDSGAQLIFFPEVHLYPFFPQYQKTGEGPTSLEIDDLIVSKFREKSRQLSIISIPNIYLKEGSKKFDASVVIGSKGELVGIAKMVHVVQVEKFYEQDYYTPSDSGFQVYDTSIGKIGMVICFDRHFPESIRICVLKGAEIIIIPTVNTKEEQSEMFEWELRVQAMQNSVFIAMCNRVGTEGDMHFSGESIVIDPNGDVVKKADDSEQILLADLQLNMVKECREKRKYLQLRRPGMYSDLTK